MDKGGRGGEGLQKGRKPLLGVWGAGSWTPTPQRGSPRRAGGWEGCTLHAPHPSKASSSLAWGMPASPQWKARGVLG